MWVSTCRSSMRHLLVSGAVTQCEPHYFTKNRSANQVTHGTELFAACGATEAIECVVVHHAHGLHVRVDHGGAQELKAALLQVLGPRHGFVDRGRVVLDR